MSRRIEIELTSQAADGSWTWRAAGARQPRGTIEAAVVPSDATVGTVFRAEVESGMDGIEISALLPVKTTRSEPLKDSRIEVIGAPRKEPDVSVTLAGGGRRRRDDDGRPGRREGGPRRPREDRPDRKDPRGRRPSNGQKGRDERSGEEGGRERRSGPPPRRERDRERRPQVSSVHRNAVLATLGPEQLPVAEQLLRGGIAAVRQAIDEQNAAAKAADGQPASVDALMAIADELLPVLRLAEWKDRATSAQNAGRDFRLRELRTVVAGSRTVILDEEGRALAKALQESLESRITALRQDWEAKITGALDDNRPLDALRISTRPPESGTRCPAALAVRLAETAGAAMTAETDSGEWQAMLAAVLDSPVRRTVKPVGIPEGEEAHAAARRAAGLVPELAKLLGLRIPPPPPRRTVRRPVLTPSSRGESNS